VKTINIKSSGTVIKVLPDQKYRVKLTDKEHIVLCQSSGRMKNNKIKILEGDSVDIEMSPYDFSIGRITYRHK